SRSRDLRRRTAASPRRPRIGRTRTTAITAAHVCCGRRVTSLFVALPVAEADLQARLVEIAAATKRLKSSGAAGGPTALLDLAALAPPVVVHATLARTEYSTRLFNVTITNVPGQQQPLYAFGSLMREIYPFVPLAAEHAVGIAIFSYNGSVTFGISADSEATPDIDVLAYGIESGLEKLRALARDRVMPA
ncbi:MAG TPA: WS/DGAT domain-containing protein, partial [Solirubrobacteraceae bacterium]|nr:WS/DGAT domain-containing protein [Solirubrobacteraceae bacterium]